MLYCTYSVVFHCVMLYRIVLIASYFGVLWCIGLCLLHRISLSSVYCTDRDIQEVQDYKGK